MWRHTSLYTFLCSWTYTLSQASLTTSDLEIWWGSCWTISILITTYVQEFACITLSVLRGGCGRLKWAKPSLTFTFVQFYFMSQQANVFMSLILSTLALTLMTRSDNCSSQLFLVRFCWNTTAVYICITTPPLWQKVNILVEFRWFEFKGFFSGQSGGFWVLYHHIYQPLRSDRIWHNVNF